MNLNYSSAQLFAGSLNINERDVQRKNVSNNVDSIMFKGTFSLYCFFCIFKSKIEIIFLFLSSLFT